MSEGTGITTSQAIYQACMAMLQESDPIRANHSHLSRVLQIERANLYFYADGKTSPTAATIGKLLKRWTDAGYEPLAVVFAANKCWAGPASSIPRIPDPPVVVGADVSEDDL